MERQEVAVEMPDAFGIPEYFISNVVTEVDGPNVRVICGVKRGGRIEWLYSCVMRADNLAIAAVSCGNAAAKASGVIEMFSLVAH